VNSLKDLYTQRVEEIETYLELLDTIDREIKEGRSPTIEVMSVITVTQQRMLYASFYLQLYNLVEATVSYCLDALSSAMVQEHKWYPADLSPNFRKEWVRTVAKTHHIKDETRLNGALEMFEQLVQSKPIPTPFHFDMKQNGNWDDEAIRKTSEKLGLRLTFRADVEANIKRPYRDDKRPLEFVKHLRNRLAHGNISFTECGSTTTVADLHELKRSTVEYLNDVVASFASFIESQGFISQDKRPPSNKFL